MEKKDIKIDKDSTVVEELSVLGLSYVNIKKLLKNKDVKVNGERIKEDCVLFAGDNLTIFYTPDQIQKTEIEIIYQDDNIIVADKPAGIESDGKGGLAEKLKAIAVHRLDRNTMGLVVYALNKTAEKELLDSFKVREIDKTYNCIVVGAPKQHSAKLKAFLFKDAKKSQVYISNTQKQGYVPIETHYQVLKPWAS